MAETFHVPFCIDFLSETNDAAQLCSSSPNAMIAEESPQMVPLHLAYSLLS